MFTTTNLQKDIYIVGSSDVVMFQRNITTVYAFTKKNEDM